MMNPRVPAIDDLRRHKRRKILQPQAGTLGLAVTELPRLDALGEVLKVRDPALGVLVHHRVLDGDPLDRRIPEVREEGGALVQFCPHLFACLAGRRDGQPAHARIAQPRTRRVRDHQQIPPIVQKVARIADDMAVRPVLAGQQVA